METTHDLMTNGLKIIQSDTLYRFTTDAVLLANFCGSQKGKTAVDLGSGSGIVAILLAGKHAAKSVVGVEIQQVLAEMSVRSVQLNNLDDVITIVNAPLQGIHQQIGTHAFDTVVCNPPYRKQGSGERQTADTLAICRHEVAVTLSEVIAEAAALLNTKGSFFLVHQSDRIGEICYTLKQHNLEPKIIQPVAPRVNTQPNLVLVKAVKGGNTGCILRSPLCIMDKNGQLTPEVKALYNITDKENA
jgi:tRNA1(Val) A37 N6-methylase TrmN6